MQLPLHVFPSSAFSHARKRAENRKNRLYYGMVSGQTDLFPYPLIGIYKFSICLNALSISFNWVRGFPFFIWVFSW